MKEDLRHWTSDHSNIIFYQNGIFFKFLMIWVCLLRFQNNVEFFKYSKFLHHKIWEFFFKIVFLQSLLLSHHVILLFGQKDINQNN